ncbi:MAG: hypothetical protein HGB01_07465 [Chlorobiaceae bacterium]|nr:hypothetical protein [Chlorobiaceae bacterium]NTV26034.1 hypothetical protein [Chlorobiaceae bacterium]
MNYSFKYLWNFMFVIVGPVWAVLAWMIWTSGQLTTPQHQSLYLGIVIPGFVLIYLSGFIVQKRHAKKLRNQAS